MNIFYQSHVQWFENVANGLIWLIIVAVIAFAIWLGWDLITGPKRQREDVERMLKGLDDVQTTGKTSSLSGAVKPFQHKRKKSPAQTQI